MKERLKRYKTLALNHLNSYRYKLLFLVTIIVSIFAVSEASSKYGVFVAFYESFTNCWVIFFLFIIIMINTIDFCNLYKNNHSIMTRNISKKQYIKELMYSVVLSNLILFLTYILCISSLLILKCLGNFSITNSIYGINIILVNLYVLFKILLISLLSSYIILLLYFIFNKVVSYIVGIIISVLLVTVQVSYIIRSSFVLFYGFYLTGGLFTNITLDILYFIIIALMFELIVLLLYKLSCVKKIDMG